jgi:glutamyl-tRNA synthetase
MKVFVPQPLFENEEFNPKSLEEVDGFAEEAVSNLKTGEIVQFERFGFVRIENKNKQVTGFFAHK